MKLKLKDVDLVRSFTYHAWSNKISTFIFIEDAASFFNNTNAKQLLILIRTLRDNLGKSRNYNNVSFSPSSFSESINWVVI